MKIQIENLKAKMTGVELNIYQKADALIEFNKLLDYVDELEQLTIPVVGNCTDCNAEINYTGLCEICHTEYMLKD